jgi:cysteinyl-tRNA synthetase
MSHQTPAVDAAPRLHIYNTRTRAEEPFTSIVPGKVGMYVCGVTVYDSAHIGHGMSSIIFDIIRRYLLHIGYEVRYAQNFTDIDDKIINRAIAEGIPPTDLTERLIAEWDEEIGALNILPATVAPRATQEIPEIIEMIEGLIEKGHAYEARGDVYFSVRSFPGYGKPQVSASRSATSNRTRSTSCSGNHPNRANLPGPVRGARAGRAGISNARQCARIISTVRSTSMAAAGT